MRRIRHVEQEWRNHAVRCTRRAISERQDEPDGGHAGRHGQHRTQGLHRDGSTVGDSSEEARKRQSGTELTIAGGRYLDDNWVLIDTPGSVEFCQDTRNACMVADVAVVVVEPEIAKIVAVSPVLKFLDTHDIPHVIVINKMDQASERVRDLLAALQDMSERPLILRQVPIRNGD